LATFIKILPIQNIKRFDTPPILTGEQRKKFFTMQKWVIELLNTFTLSTNKIGFLLQLGYFRAFNKFTQEMKELLIKETDLLTSRQQKPRLIFMSLVDFLQSKKIQVPTYYTFAEIITESLINYEKELVMTINKSLTKEEKEMLDDLLKKEETEIEPKRYTITNLKSQNHSIRAGKIKENIEDYEYLESIFSSILPVLNKLKLPLKVIKYYAEVVFRSQVFQLSRRDDNRYLYLISFLVNNFYELNDMLVIKVNKAVQQSKNSVEREERELLFENKYSKMDLMKNIALGLTQKKNAVGSIKNIMFDTAISPLNKIEAVIRILEKDSETDKVIDEDLLHIDDEINRLSNNEDYYDTLEKKSRKLQNRVSSIIKHFIFDIETSNNDLLNALIYFKEKDGRIDANAPLNHFDDKELKVLFDKHKKVRVSLYKILLFIKLSHGIRSGALNLHYSYNYRAFENYLISIKLWNKNKAEYLERSGLSEFIIWDDVEKGLK